MADYVVEFGKDGRPVEPDGRLDAPAFHRNHEAIRMHLSRFLADQSGDVVEAGSGTGQHVVDFARHMPGIIWWPSDLNEQHLRSIAAWRAHAGLDNIRPPLRIDLSDPAWCPEMHDGSGPRNLLAVFCANVIHIAPWRVAEGLFAGAGTISAGGRAAFFVWAVQARRQAHRHQQCGVRYQSARSQSRMGRARHRGAGKAGRSCRTCAGGNRRDARQQSDSGVRAAEAGLNRSAWPAPVCVG